MPHSISLAEVIPHDELKPHRPTFAEVSTDALVHNFTAFKNLAASARVMAVVKADAYGHGLLNCARLFSELGADYLGVAFVEEGIALRRAGFKERILVLGGIVGSQIKLFLDFDLEMTASSVFKLQAIEREAESAGKPGIVHLKIDTGLNRIGQNFRTAEALLQAAKQSKHVRVAGIYSHMATAEQNVTSFAELQIQRFNEVIESAKAIGLNDTLFHLANSACAINFPQAHFDMIRPGLGLYGFHASRSLESKLALRPAMTLKSEIVYMKGVRKGEGVSYGLKWTAPENCWIATVAVGYGDGYPRHLSNNAEVLIQGKRYPQVGSICMDQIMVNLGRDKYPVGEEVVLWGQQRDAALPLWELCEKGGFIPYELPIYLTGRVPRVLKA
ncbi:alanine racemase [bacterium]|nr:alanine racemase [bacterium]